jgi:hypothetical protein
VNLAGHEVERLRLDVERAAAQLRLAEEKLGDAILAARQANVSLRTIAAAAGTSHEQVRRIVLHRLTAAVPQAQRGGETSS